MKFLKRRYYGKPRCEEDWKQALSKYVAHLASIHERLPDSVKELVKHDRRRPFHDAVVESIVRRTPEDFTIELDDRRLEFIGVSDCEYPNVLEDGITWLFEEIDLLSLGVFELHAVLDEGEIRVVAKDVRLYDKLERRYVIPDEPCPPASTLFLDRKTRRKNRR
jgi:hypothetical protein